MVPLLRLSFPLPPLSPLSLPTLPPHTSSRQGAVGIVAKPVQGAERSGIARFLPTLCSHTFSPQGAVGIVAKPVQGAERSGIAGFFGGVARGLAGAVAAPVTGTLSAFSKV